MVRKAPVFNFKNITAERLLEIQKIGIAVRKARSKERARNKQIARTFSDIAKGLLEMAVIVRNPTTKQQIIDESTGKPLTISMKELIMVKTLNNIIDNPNMKQVEALAKIIGEVNDGAENNINLILKDVKEQITGENNVG